MPRLKHLDIKNFPYFVTSKTRFNREVFTTKENADRLLSCFYYGREKGWYYLLSFVIMPHHFHIILVPQERNISEAIKGIKGYSSTVINRATGKSGSLWQEGFYDYIIDGEDKLVTKARYIEENPVRKGLTSEAQSYPYSSAYHENPTDLELYLKGARD